MSLYVVEYTPDADDQLTLIWLNAKDRNGITHASHLIHQFLARTPHNGRALSEGLWSAVANQVVAIYEINELDSVVTVTSFGTVKP